uniref:Uncharacterized protein n=1 Tax=Panagrolaimus superbus TaxID=310955 RepID=A0A914YQW3_9BILA
MSEDRWPIAKPQSYSQKIKVESLIVEQITKQSQKCKPAADILLKNMDELVEILVQCFENSPENALADYVWKFIKKDSKFVEIKCLLFDVASVLECNRQNIINTKLNLSATKSVGFSTPSSSETNFNQNLNMELVLPNKIVESEDEEEDESETEMHICRPRGFSYYSKFVSTKKSVTPPQNVERSSDEYSLDSDNEESSDVTPESQDRFEKNTVFSKNEEDDSDEDIPRFLPRNLDRYKSSASTSKQPVIRRSVFDHISDDEDIPSDRRKDIIFDEKIAADNERVPKIYDPHSGNTKRSALQPHETIDYENQVNMEGPNPSRLLTAFPNQIGPCRKPECFVLEQWIPMTDYDDHINSAFSAFKNSEYVTDLNKKCPEHLFIFDSMMSGIPFESTYKNVECIDCGFPNNPLKHFREDIGKVRSRTSRNDSLGYS